MSTNKIFIIKKFLEFLIIISISIVLAFLSVISGYHYFGVLLGSFFFLFYYQRNLIAKTLQSAEQENKSNEKILSFFALFVAMLILGGLLGNLIWELSKGDDCSG